MKHEASKSLSTLKECFAQSIDQRGNFLTANQRVWLATDIAQNEFVVNNMSRDGTAYLDQAFGWPPSSYKMSPLISGSPIMVGHATYSLLSFERNDEGILKSTHFGQTAAELASASVNRMFSREHLSTTEAKDVVFTKLAGVIYDQAIHQPEIGPISSLDEIDEKFFDKLVTASDEFFEREQLKKLYEALFKSQGFHRNAPVEHSFPLIRNLFRAYQGLPVQI